MNNDPQGRTTSSGLDVVSLASTLASDLAHLVESMNLADRPTNTSSQGNANKGGRGGRPLTARAMGQEGRFSKLDMSAAELSSELNLAFGDSVGTTPTPPPTCQAFSTLTPPPNCPPPPPPQLNNQALLDLASSDERSGEVGHHFKCRDYVLSQSHWGGFFRGFQVFSHLASFHPIAVLEASLVSGP